MKNPFKYTFDREYELALKEGKKRFGSPCKHTDFKNGICMRCLRKVQTRAMTATAAPPG